MVSIVGVTAVRKIPSFVFRHIKNPLVIAGKLSEIQITIIA